RQRLYPVGRIRTVEIGESFICEGAGATFEKHSDNGQCLSSGRDQYQFVAPYESGTAVYSRRNCRAVAAEVGGAGRGDAVLSRGSSAGGGRHGYLLCGL